jgi:ClpA/ClpB-like protein
MWEPLRERARRAVVLAQEEAQRLGNSYIETEHILALESYLKGNDEHDAR